MGSFSQYLLESLLMPNHSSKQERYIIVIIKDNFSNIVRFSYYIHSCHLCNKQFCESYYQNSGAIPDCREDSLKVKVGSFKSGSGSESSPYLLDLEER